MYDLCVIDTDSGVCVDCAAGRGYTRSDAKAHEAGYDAYVTGLCFLAMQAHLARMRGESSARVPPPDSPLLKPFLNKLFLSRTAHQDSPYINLTGPERTYRTVLYCTT